MSILFAAEDITDPKGFSWSLLTDKGDVQPVATEDVSSISAKRVVLVVSGKDVHVNSVDVKTSSEKEFRTAALYQIEDDVSEALNKLFLAVGAKPNGAGLRQVAIVSTAKMNEWLAFLDDSGLADQKVEIVPDITLLDEGDAPVVYASRDHVLLSNSSRGYAIEPSLATDILPALLQELDIQSARYLQSADSALNLNGTLSDRLIATDDSIDYPLLLARGLDSGLGINLRQGKFAQLSDFNIDMSGWMSTLGLAVAAGIAWLAYLGFSVWGLERQADAIYAQSQQVYRAQFPEEGQVSDPLSESRKKLQEAGQNTSIGGFSALLSVFYKSIEQAEGSELVAFNYNAEANRLSATFHFSSFQDRDTLKAAFEESGLVVELGGVRQENGFLTGQAVIGEAAS